MASLVQGYEYDIFISYRQKDNRGDRWVSNFVEALKTELDATFKEDVSIYFDENPRDGLLETHDVDESLKDKLKCLVFIPIVSRTYCDPKSFAWEHEFKAFVRQATKDRFGLKVKLPGGNVATRVLPIRIHELSLRDSELCQDVLGGAIRGVDFIYSAPGVNRPLRADEDHLQDNLSRTYYRDQINKVANAVENIIHSLQYSASGLSAKTPADLKEYQVFKDTAGLSIPRKLSRYFLTRRSRVFLCGIIVILGIILMYRFIYYPAFGKTVAVLPLVTFDRDSAFVMTNANDLMMEVYNNLRNERGLKVRSIYTSFKYRNTTKSTKVLRRELRANYLVSAIMDPSRKRKTVRFELIRAKYNTAVLSEDFIWDGSIPAIGEKIARVTASGLKKVRPFRTGSGENVISTDNAFARLTAGIGDEVTREANFWSTYGNKLMDSVSFQQAIDMYDRAIKLDPEFASAYAMRSIARSMGFYRGQFDTAAINRCKEDIDKALVIDETLPEVQNALGFYFYYCKKDLKAALEHFTEAATKEPDKYEPLFYTAMVYRRMGDWQSSQKLINKVVQFEPQEALFLTNIGLSYTYLHKYDSALLYHQKAIDAMPGWSLSYKNMIETSLLRDGSTNKAWSILRTASNETGENLNEQRILLNIYDNKYEDALKLAEEAPDEDFKIFGSKYINLALISSYLKRPGDAIRYYDSALVVLKREAERKPGNEDIQGYIGIALAGKGRSEDAKAAGQEAVLLAGNDGLHESDMQIMLARIYAMTRDYDNSIKLIENLLGKPSCISTRLLKIDPLWEPLRKVQKFRSLISEYSN